MKCEWIDFTLFWVLKKPVLCKY